MKSILTTTLTALALVLGLSALSARTASANGGGLNMEEGPYDWQRDRNGRLGNLPGLDPKFGAFMGGVRVVMVIDAAGKAKGAAGKKNCVKLRDAIAKGERRLEQMKSRLEQMLEDFSEKRRVNTKADVGYSAHAIARLEDAILAKENSLKMQRKKLKRC